MEDLKVTAPGYDFKPAQAAMQRYVDNNLLSGISWAVMVGRDLVGGAAPAGRTLFRMNIASISEQGETLVLNGPYQDDAPINAGVREMRVTETDLWRVAREQGGGEAHYLAGC